MRTTIKPIAIACALASSAPALAMDDLMINGFLSAGFGALSSDEITIGSFDQDLSVKEDTVFGLQISKSITEELSVTGQLVARGNEDYEVDGAWAYAKYQLNPETYARVGRIRLPLFHFSDFQEVGYSYLWIRPPAEVYQFNFSSVDAVDVNHQMQLGEVTADFQLYAGQMDVDFNGLKFENDNLVGLIGKFSYSDFQFRAGMHEATATIEPDATLSALIAQDPSFATDRNKVRFTSVSANYDNGTNILFGEWTLTESGSSVLADTTSWLVMYGHRIGQYTLHLTYTETDTELESSTTEFLDFMNALSDIHGSDTVTGALLTGQLATLIPGSGLTPPTTAPSTGDLQTLMGQVHQESSTIAGVKYDMDGGVALKFEVQYNDEKKIQSQHGEAGVLYSFAVDTVF